MKKKRSSGLSYAKSGVNIAATDRAKRGMAASLATKDKRVLNSIGAFASLYDASFPGYEHPVLVLKTEEPGSKQKLAAEHGSMRSVCFDMIHHLINDIAVMGAVPLAVQDAVICGTLDEKTVQEIVRGIADACRAQDCVLTGGETSVQPGILPAGTYILTASIVGVVEKSKIIDGSRIRAGDTVLAVPSNGLHTNGYSLVRTLMERRPEILQSEVRGVPFLRAILEPHTCYYRGIRALHDAPALHGMAHITGGGIEGNLNRVLPKNLDAVIEREAIRILPLFSLIREMGDVSDADMLQTFNMGVGLTLVVETASVESVQKTLKSEGYESYPIGKVVKGKGMVRYGGKALRW